MAYNKVFGINVWVMFVMTMPVCFLPVFTAKDYGWAFADTIGNKEKRVPVTLKGKTIQVHLADSDADRHQGLLGWNTITDADGMLLDFIHEGTYAIHMQGMKFPIDAIWMDSQGVVKLIYEDIQPNSGQIYPSMFPSRYCLEVKTGFCRRYGIRVGDRMQFGDGK